jgi:YidC/Oxa1 family membrane protein insertase
MADELVNVDASDKYGEEDLNGRVEWAAIRSKYFLVSMIPMDPSRTNGVTIGGIKTTRDGIPEKDFKFNIEARYEPIRTYKDHFRVYLGPLDYYVLNKYDANLEDLVMNKDWYERLFRPISLLIIPAFKFLYRFIPNYGFVIIVFSILIKLVLHPLTKKSYQSMSEMQYLQPKMTELREKYKDDPQRINKEMMKLYKEHKINPLGGCIPMLLQMPVLFSLFIVFRSTIQLRNQPFILWINDLSAPDALHLGFQLPFIGDNIHVLPILMGLTMIWQSKMTMTDPKQKLMIYFMPVFLIFIFYSLPSGLNLYYAIFNVLSMFQTRMIKKKMHPAGEAEAAPAAAKANPPKSPKKSTRSKRKR